MAPLSRVSPHTSQIIALLKITSSRFGSLLNKTFIKEFHTNLFSSLPPSFAGAFKKLCESTVGAEPEPTLWMSFELLGLLERYENLVASVCYEQIEARVQALCPGNWSEQMLPVLRTWMSNEILQWMILPYARDAKTRMF